MTTIAYRDGLMAADSLVSCSNGLRRGYHRKIVRLQDGSLVAGCGDSGGIAKFVKWADAGFDMSSVPAWDKEHGFGAIVVRPTGVVEVWNDKSMEPQPHDVLPFGIALGSGNECALAAMVMGADSRRAVEVAIMLDTGSGGEIQVERL